MHNFRNGMLAGAAATAVLSILMIMKSAMGLMPQLDLIAMLAKMMGQPGIPVVGWIGHALIGIVGYGLVIALLDRDGEGSEGSMVGRGVMIACVGWLIMMVVLMPMAGAGLFGMNLGIMAPIMTLILHLVFGAVLGSVYGALKRGARNGSAA